MEGSIAENCVPVNVTLANALVARFEAPTLDAAATS
jgi:hypothetical protein